MDAQQLQQIEQSLIDELFANLMQPPQPVPLRIVAPQDELPRPYYRGPTPDKIAQRQAEAQRSQIKEQLRALVETSTARLYEMLAARLDEMKAQQIEADRQRQEAEQQRLILEIASAARVSPPCTPSRSNRY